MRRFVNVALISAFLLAGCNLGQVEPTPAPTPDRPRVEFLFPEADASVIEGTDLTIDLVARDETVGVNRIELLLNGIRLSDAPTEDGLPRQVYRVEMNWIAQGPGLHNLTAIAFRPDGTASAEVDLTLEVLER